MVYLLQSYKLIKQNKIKYCIGYLLRKNVCCELLTIKPHL